MNSQPYRYIELLISIPDSQSTAVFRALEPAEGIAILRDIANADREQTDIESVLETWLTMRVEP